MPTYSHLSSFHWQTDLTEARRKEILEWVASLPKDKLAMLEDCLTDTKDAEMYHHAELEAGEDI